MNWYSFFFSTKKSHHVRRHLVFWVLWWVYFTASYYHYAQTGLQKVAFEPLSFPFFLKSIVLLSIHVAACYYFISYLMPRYLFNAKYIALVTQILFLCFMILVASYFIHKAIFPLINKAFNYKPVIADQNIWWTSISSGLLSAPKVICAAAAVKLLKRWWLKQKEKERLEREKLMTDLQLLKAQMHPEFLFSSLDNICVVIQKKNIDMASMLLLKLADILSYMLYECDNESVLLDKELKAIRDYLVLEKTRMGKRLEMDVAVNGETAGKMIAPLLLYSIVENSFSYINNKELERNWLNLEFQIEPREITMKLIHGKAADVLVLPGGEKYAIAKAMKRLEFFYPGNYELKTTVEPEIMMTYLRITLEESVTEDKDSNYTPENMMYATT